MDDDFEQRWRDWAYDLDSDERRRLAIAINRLIGDCTEDLMRYANMDGGEEEEQDRALRRFLVSVERILDEAC